MQRAFQKNQSADFFFARSTGRASQPGTSKTPNDVQSSRSANGLERRRTRSKRVPHQPSLLPVAPIVEPVLASHRPYAGHNAPIEHHARPHEQQRAQAEKDSHEARAEDERPGPHGEGEQFAPSGQSLLFFVAFGLGEVVQVEVAVRACTQALVDERVREGGGKKGDAYKSNRSSRSCPWGCSGISDPVASARQSGSA